tara:strand:- start:132 stop:1142 length:1011 start_codon:yes stop_codon:yes gene_type:complete
MNHLDLFSGIGGFSLGLKQSGIDPDWIGFSDIDTYANKVFKRRFPNAKELGSITTIQPDKLPKIDLITFGFPCQDLSIAGKRGGLAANRSSLFFEAIKIIQHKKPKYFIFENVKGIFSSNGGKDFDIVLRSIADIGYDGQWELCNTRWYLPQNRERVYFVGHIRGESRPKVFPLGENDSEIKDDGERKKLNQIATIGEDSEATRVYDTTCARTIKNGGGMGAKTGLYKVKSAALRGRDNNPSGNLEIRNDDVANCIIKGSNSSLVTYDYDKKELNQKTSIRRLTPTECERLQGFPDGWTDEQSDTQRYKQLGNAVSVPVVKAVMERLYSENTNNKM